MWSQYDEDLSQNVFFKEIKQNHEDILKRAADEHWVICIPRRGSLKNEDISISVILDHVLVQNTEASFSTLNKNEVRIDHHHLMLDQNNIFYRDIEVLFEETHYLEQTAKYLVWCVNWPLFLLQNHKHDTQNNVILVTIQDCIDFLYSEAFGLNLLESIQKLCLDFWKSHENSLEIETLQSQKDFIGNLYSQCLQLCFKSDIIIRDKYDKNVIYLDNLKLSVETYMQYCLGKKLMYCVNTFQHFTDIMINKTVRNSFDITLSDLNIPKDFGDFVLDGQYELSRINNFVTVLDKVHCLSQTFNVFNNKYLKKNEKLYVTSDDFLQILVFLILKSNVPNWMANLTYLKEFQFAAFDNCDQTNFLVTSLEAAMAFIQSSEFLGIKQSRLNYTHNSSTLFDRLFVKFRDKRNLAELNEILGKEQERKDTELCHPLCSCSKCKKIHSQKVDSSTPYKILNNLNQNFIIVAAIDNDPNFLDFLLSFDFDLNFKDTSGKTALHHAAERGSQDILLLLINAKAKVNVLDNDRNSALHLACDRGHDNCVKALIYSSNFVEINLQNISGDTPLFLATRWGYFDIIKILLENGASVCVKNNRNLSVYKLAANYYITRLFRQFGSQKSNNILEEVIKDKIENTLDVSEDCCNKILEEGVLFGTQAKTNSVSKKIALLLKAIENNDMPLTCFYLGYSSNSPEDYTNENVSKKCHPLCTCAKCSNRDDCEEPTDSVCEQYSYNNKKDCKLNVNMCVKEGFTPLHIAAKFGRTDILRVLLDNGALLNVHDNKTYYTPLHLAVMFQRVQTVKELLKCGNCKVDARDFKGNTPLYYASVRNGNNLKIVELLIQNDADCQMKNYEEKTILQICEEKNLFRVCRMLRNSMGGVSGQTKGVVAKSSHKDVSFDDIDSDFEFF